MTQCRICEELLDVLDRLRREKQELLNTLSNINRRMSNPSDTDLRSVRFTDEEVAELQQLLCKNA